MKRKKTFLLILLRSYWSHLAWLLALGLSVNGIALCFPVLLKSMVEGISTASSLDPTVYFLVVLAATGGFLATGIRDWMVARVSARFEKDLASSIIAKLLTVPLSTLRRKAQGEWITVLHQISDLKWIVGQAGSQAFFDLVLVLGYSGILFYYDLSSGYLYLSLLIVVSFSMRWLGKIIFRAVDNAYQGRCAAESSFVESLRNGLQVRAFQLGAWSHRRWSEPFFRSVDNVRRADFLGNCLTSFFDLVHRVTPLLFLAWKLPLLNSGEMSLGTLLAISTTLSIGFDPVLRILSFSTYYQKALRSYRGLKEVSSEDTEIPNCTNRLPIEGTPLPLSVSVKDLSYGYTSESPVLSSLSFQIRAGEAIGLAGLSGSGKTTLMSLFLRFYEPSLGEILFDGRNIKEIPVDVLRSWIGMVEQEVSLFDATVLENVAVGDATPNTARVWECLELVSADDFVRSLPNGLDTMLTNGLGVSAGQKQRLALARALYWNPRLLILDEPTSSLDNFNEKHIQNSFHKIRRGRTVIVSAHRLHTLAQCDRILVLEKGRLVEQGSHEDLVQTDGTYSRLWRLRREDRAESLASSL